MDFLLALGEAPVSLKWMLLLTFIGGLGCGIGMTLLWSVQWIADIVARRVRREIRRREV
jgi:hypothetical protein